LHGLSTIARVILHHYHPQYKDNSNFTKEILASFIEVATPHMESSLMGAKGGGPSTRHGFRCLETTTKSGNKTC